MAKGRGEGQTSWSTMGLAFPSNLFPQHVLPYANRPETRSRGHDCRLHLCGHAALLLRASLGGLRPQRKEPVHHGIFLVNEAPRARIAGN